MPQPAPSPNESVQAPEFSERALRQCARALDAFKKIYCPLYPDGYETLRRHFTTLEQVWAWAYEIDVAVEDGDPLTPALKELAPMEHFGRSLGLWGDEVRRDFIGAAEYYAFEHRWSTRQELTVDGVLQANRRRSFDFRLVHTSLCSLRGVPRSAELFEWLRSYEVLMEIEDDLGSIPRDRRQRVFNVWVMAAEIDGHDGFQQILEHRRELEQGLHDRLADLPAEERVQGRELLDRYRKLAPRPGVDRLVERARRLLRIQP